MKNSIISLLQKLNIKWKLKGKEVAMLCPFHHDVHASFSINTKNGKWGCWSCLTAGKTLESFLKKLKGNDVKLSDYLTDLDIINGTIDGIYSSSEKIFFEYEDLSSFQEMIHDEFSHNFVDAECDPESRAYLTGPKRKLSIETIRKYRLQYAKSGEYVGRIIIPYIRNKEIIGFNSRLIKSDKSQDKELRYRYCIYTESFKDFVYGMEEIENVIILVEGPFDLMWMKQLGYKNTLSTLSTLIRPMQLYHLLKFYTIVFLYDNDENKAGEKAVMKNAEKIFEIAPQTRMLFGKLPDFKDPNDCSAEEISNSLKNLKRLKKSEELLSFQF